MELSTITTFFSNPSGWGLLLLLALVVERLITGGYLRLMVGKKTVQEDRNRMQDGRDSAAANISWDILERMKTLELHFNHETTEQYRTMIDTQKETLEILRRIERDGIRIRQ